MRKKGLSFDKAPSRLPVVLETPNAVPALISLGRIGDRRSTTVNDGDKRVNSLFNATAS